MPNVVNDSQTAWLPQQITSSMEKREYHRTKQTTQIIPFVKGHNTNTAAPIVSRRPIALGKDIIHLEHKK